MLRFSTWVMMGIGFRHWLFHAVYRQPTVLTVVSAYSLHLSISASEDFLMSLPRAT